MRPQMETPPGGSREALGDTIYYDFWNQCSEIQQTLQGVMLAAFIGEFLALAVVVTLAVFAVGGGR